MPDLTILPEILKLASERSCLPSETLCDYAYTKGWLGMSRSNWLMNVRPAGRVTDARQRIMLYEIQKTIIAGYLRECLLESATSDAVRELVRKQ